MPIESFTHAYGNNLDETILCTRRDELDHIMMIIPQTFAGFEYTMNHKQTMKGWRVRIKAVRKKEQVKQPVVQMETQPTLPGIDMTELEAKHDMGN